MPSTSPFRERAVIGVTCERELKNRLDDFAHAARRTAADVGRQAIEEFLQRAAAPS